MYDGPRFASRTGRSRDSQKSKVYEAEGVLSKFKSAHAQRLLETKTVYTYNKEERVTIQSCQAYVDDLLQQRWFQSRWGRRTIEVAWKAYGSATGHTSGKICLPPWARTEQVILHEVAHTLVRSTVAAHGPEFAATLLVLAENRLGKDAAAALRKSYAEKKVKYRTGLASVPKAGTRTVVTKSEREAKARREQEQREALLVTPERRRYAAEIIRAAVKAGVYGPSGSKPRAQALATARALDPQQRLAAAKKRK